MRSAKHNSVTRENPFHTDPGRDSDTPGSVSRGEARGGVHPGTAWPSVKPGVGPESRRFAKILNHNERSHLHTTMISARGEVALGVNTGKYQTMSKTKSVTRENALGEAQQCD